MHCNLIENPIFIIHLALKMYPNDNVSLIGSFCRSWLDIMLNKIWDDTSVSEYQHTLNTIDQHITVTNSVVSVYTLHNICFCSDHSCIYLTLFSMCVFISRIMHRAIKGHFLNSQSSRLHPA